MKNIFKNEVTKKEFARFVWPSVLMMAVIGIYYGVDSVFVANLAGEKALAALAIAYPVEGIMWGFAIMLAAGSSAIIAIIMGRGDQKHANEKFTLVCTLGIVLGILFSILSFIFMPYIVDFLGATPTLKTYCHDFLEILIWGFPAAFLGSLLEYFIRIDGRPSYTLILYLSGALVHIFLDYILMGPFNMGIKGTAWANVGSLFTIMIMGISYFFIKDTSLSFSRFKCDWGFIGRCFVNGSSEMVTESSSGITTFFFNIVTISIAGDTGVAAVSIVLSIHYLFISIHLGYIMGVSPLISYFYGAQQFSKVNTFLAYSKKIVAALSVIGAVFCFAFAKYLVMIYERPGSSLYDMALTGTQYLSVALLLCGINIFASGFFTAYGNGVVSAFISLSRSLIMVIFGLYVLGDLFGLNGVWSVLAFAEVITLIPTFFMLGKYKERYHYSSMLPLFVHHQ